MTSILDLENSNLPIDYFTSVLPRAQYGDESAAAVDFNGSDAVLSTFDTSDRTKGVILNTKGYATNNNLMLNDTAPETSPDGYVTCIKSTNGNLVLGFRGNLTASSSFEDFCSAFCYCSSKV